MWDVQNLLCYVTNLFTDRTNGLADEGGYDQGYGWVGRFHPFMSHEDP
jgi:hypothetical protein